MKDENLVDKETYKKASKRVGFKIHLTVFVIVSLMLWLIWFFVFKRDAPDADVTFLKAILFVDCFWILILISHYLIVFIWNKTLIEKEIKKIELENEVLKKKMAQLKKESEESEVK